LYYRTVIETLIKLDPKQQVRNPAMFMVSVATVVTAALFAWLHLTRSEDLSLVIGTLSVSMGLIVLSTYFAQALAGVHSQIRAESLRHVHQEVVARRLYRPECKDNYDIIPATSLSQGDVVLVAAGDIIPADGAVIAGVAQVDESTLANKRGPIIREASIEHSAVTGSTRVLSDWIVVRVTANPGGNLFDYMFNVIEETQHRDPPHKTFLKGMLASSAVLVLLVVIVLFFSYLSGFQVNNQGIFIAIITLITLLVALSPTTTGGLLSVIDIAALDRLVRHNIIPLRGQDAMEAAGKVEILLLDKSAVIVPDYRRAAAFFPLSKTNVTQAAEVVRLISQADRTLEGENIIALTAKQIGTGDNTEGLHLIAPTEEYVVPYSAETGVSGLDFNGMRIGKGTPDAIAAYPYVRGYSVSPELRGVVERIAGQGGVPVVVTLDGQAIGVAHIRALVNKYLKTSLGRLRQMALKTVIVTGDSPVVAAAIAAEAGMDDFLASTTPETKLALVQRYRASGQRVALIGKCVDDVSVLTEADLGVASNNGAHVVRGAAHMIDLDSNPIKLIEIVEMGHQWLVTRQALTLLSKTIDVVKCFVLIPALLATVFPTVAALNFLHLASPASAILAMIILNVVSILTLLPLALRGLPYRLISTARAQRNTLLVCGLGGLIAPFIGIRLIDLVLVSLGIN
jgi:K+-transporting ATPase ATPase B chain